VSALRLLVTGAGGMLGHDVLRAGARAGHDLLGLARSQLDVTDVDEVKRALERARADLGGLDAVVNCAAFTDVDGAETQRDQAFAVNADGAEHLARAAAAAEAALVHVSSDYVFAGEAPLDARGEPRAYVESDPTGPRSAYGQSKLAGERAVLAASSRHTVARSSWLFGLDGRNFVATMLKLGAERDAVQVVTDQVGCPTWTGHLAPALIGVVQREVRGLAHLAGAGHTSWNGFAREIFRQAGVNCRVEPASTAEMARPAPRPAWSALESERDDLVPMPDWRDGLAGYLAARAGMIRT
jgi:dTDP-4-dehydrorhamnose reductase